MRQINEQGRGSIIKPYSRGEFIEPEKDRLVNLNFVNKHRMGGQTERESEISQFLALSSRNEKLRSDERSVQFASEVMKDMDRQLDPEMNMKSDFEQSTYKQRVRFEKPDANRQRNKSFDVASQRSTGSILSNQPRYYQKIPEDIREIDAKNYISETSLRLNSSNLKDSSKILRDPKGYILVKPRGSEALKDVIMTQREKLDRYKKTENFLRDELKARENHILNLQQENQTLLAEKKSLTDNLNAFKLRSQTAMANADDSTKVAILEDQLR